MSIFSRIIALFSKKVEVAKQSTANDEGFDANNLTNNIGVGNRSSVDENAYKEGSYSEVTPEFLLAILPELNKLSIFHQDFAKAVQNCIDLGNTKQEIFFDAAVSERNARKMRAHLEKVENGWYGFSSPTTFTNSLFRQIAVFGVISSECVPNVSLTGLEKVVTVNPEDICFFYRQGRYVPMQKVRAVPSGMQYRGLTPYVELNTNQYKYIPIIRSNASPYGLPPFLAAMFPADIQNDMSINFKNITKRLGAFGFLSVLLEAPLPEKNSEGNVIENKEAYKKRVEEYIVQQSQRIKDGVANGYAVGLKGKHEFNVDGTVNASNAADMYALVDTLVAAGLKQDPALLGRNRTVTETFGRVLLQIMVAQTQTMQQIVAEFLSFARLMELRLAGFNVNKVTTVFAPPLPGDEIKNEQARQLRISNARELYNQGIISQTQYAQELGYDSPFLPAPVGSSGNNAVAVDSVPVAGDGRTEPSATSSNTFATNLLPEFDYSLPKEYDSYEFGGTAWGDATMQKFADTYILAIQKKYKEAVGKTTKGVGAVLADLPKNATQAEWREAVESEMAKIMKKEFEGRIPKICNPTVKSIYDYYRKDKTIFPKKQEAGNSFAKFPPTANLDLNDKRAIEWLQKHDITFLSKFIRDVDTVNRILAFINEFYLEQGEAIGDNTRVLAEFINRFGEVLNGEIWKIRRVLDTSVNKIRSYANVAYMHQANVADFKIVEVMDRITCPHCKNMNGRTFSVTTEKEKIEKVTKGELTDIAKLSPFVTTLPVADLEKLTDKELQAKGVGATPFHPSCRGTLVAVL